MKVKLFFNIGSNGGYEALSVLNAVGFFKSNLFLITSSTFAEDRDNLVLNLPWIFEKSFPLTFTIESMFCWLVTIIHAFP